MNQNRFYDTETMYLHENRIWYTPMQVNGVACYDLMSNTNTYITCIEKEKEFRLFSRSFYRQGYIFFVPGTASYILKVNVNSNTYEKIMLNINDSFCRLAFMYDDKIFVVQTKPERRILVVDINSNMIEEVKNVRNAGEYSADMAMHDEYAYIVSYDRKEILKLNCITLSSEWITVPSEEEGYATICFDGECFWLSGKKTIIKWDEENKETKIFPINIDGFGLHKYCDNEIEKCQKNFLNNFPFWQSEGINGRVLFFPRCFNMIIQLDIDLEIMQEYEMVAESENEESLLREDRGTHGHYFVINNSEFLLLYSMASQYLYIIDRNNGQIINKIQFRRDITKEQITRNHMFGNKLYFERNQDDLMKWIKVIDGDIIIK